MKWLVLYRYTGSKASNLRIAQRVARKIQGAQRSGQCILIDCENVTVSSEFLRILVEGTRPEKARFAGLPIPDQLPNHPKPNAAGENMKKS
jgi:hypothetical protein